MSSELDLLLYRPLKDGKQFDSLIPKSTCERVDSGDGMTDYSVTQMAKLAKLYAWQMRKVAPLLKGTSLQRTCNAIHDFCYSHFQYKADTDVQLLRSPACSWYTRKIGIDCKSYSIIASCILLELNINHYIRRVRQYGFHPEMWTHVYVVVPSDQKSGNLDKGYYVIDGTVAQDFENEFIEKSDLYMQHEMLNGPGLRGFPQVGYANNYPQGGLNGSVSLDQIKSLFKGGFSLSCIGGAYDTTDFNITFNYVAAWFEAQFAKVNAAVTSNSPSLITEVQKLYVNAAQLKDHGAYTASKNWESSCSKKAAQAYADVAAYYFNIVDKAFTAWLQSYFTVQYTTVTLPNNTYEPETRNSTNSSGKSGKGFRRDQFVRDVTNVKKVSGLTLKPTTLVVYKFELTPYVATGDNLTTSFDPLQMFAGLKTIAASFSTKATGSTTNAATGVTTVNTGGVKSGTVSSGSGGVTYTDSGTVSDPNAAKVASSSTGTIIGLLALGLGVVVMTVPIPGITAPSKSSVATVRATGKRKSTPKKKV